MFEMASIWDMSQGHADAAIDWSWKEAFRTFNKDMPLYNNNGNSKERRQSIVERKPKFEMNKQKLMGDMKRIPGETKRGNVNPKQSLIEQKQNLDQKQNLMTSTYSSNVSQLTNGILDKRFKTLPPSEMLSRNETLGGYIFVCNNDTMQEDLKRKLFGLPQRYRDSVRAIQPGLPLFLYNYTTHQLHGIFEAASFGGSNIDPTAWEDKKCRGESRFPAQVRTQVRKSCQPLEEDAFRPVLYHYDGPKFRLQLSVPETLKLLDLFMENGSA